MAKYVNTLVMTRPYGEASRALENMSDESLARHLGPAQFPQLAYSEAAWQPGEPDNDLVMRDVRRVLVADLQNMYSCLFGGYDVDLSWTYIGGHNACVAIVDDEYWDNVDDALEASPVGRLNALYPLCGELRFVPASPIAPIMREADPELEALLADDCVAADYPDDGEEIQNVEAIPDDWTHATAEEIQTAMRDFSELVRTARPVYERLTTPTQYTVTTGSNTRFTWGSEPITYTATGPVPFPRR